MLEAIPGQIASSGSELEDELERADFAGYQPWPAPSPGSELDINPVKPQ